MAEQMLLKLPGNWADVETGFPLVDEGEYSVRVCKIVQEEGSAVSGNLVILDGSRFSGQRIFQRYDLATEAGLRLFKEFVEAIGVEPNSGQLDLSLCADKTLEVTVKHHDHDTKTYANVVRHRPTAQIESNV